jgi:hypothetical protein
MGRGGFFRVRDRAFSSQAGQLMTREMRQTNKMERDPIQLDRITL